MKHERGEGEGRGGEGEREGEGERDSIHLCDFILLGFVDSAALGVRTLLALHPMSISLSLSPPSLSHTPLSVDIPFLCTHKHTHSHISPDSNRHQQEEEQRRYAMVFDGHELKVMYTQAEEKATPPVSIVSYPKRNVSFVIVNCVIPEVDTAAMAHHILQVLRERERERGREGVSGSCVLTGRAVSSTSLRGKSGGDTSLWV